MKASRLRRGWLLAIIWGRWRGRSTAADPPRRAKRPPQVWAIVIGIDNYTDPAIPDSQTAADNAQSVVQWFRAAGWDESPAAPVPGLRQRRPGHARRARPQHPADQKNLNWAMDEWLRPGPRRATSSSSTSPARPRPLRSTAGPRSEPRVDHYLLPIDAPQDRRDGNRLVARRGRRPVRPEADSRGLLAGDGRRATAAPPCAPRGSPRRPCPRRPNGCKRLTRWPGVTAWLAVEPADGRSASRSIPPTRSPRPSAGDWATTNIGTTWRRASSSSSRIRGWDSRASRRRGRVPAELSLWKDEFSLKIEPPQPEMVLQAGHADRVTGLACIGRPAPALQREHGLDRPRLVARRWGPAPRLDRPDRRGHGAGAQPRREAAGHRRRPGDGPRGRPPRLLARADAEAAARQAGGPDHDAPRRQPFRLGRPRGRGAWATFGSRPSTPSPGPARGSRCVDVAGGGTPGEGTVAAAFNDGTVRIFDARRPAGPPVDTRQGRPTALAGSPTAAPWPWGSRPARSSSATSPATPRPSTRWLTGPIRSLVLAPTGWVAVGHDQGLRLCGPPAGGEARPEARPTCSTARPRASPSPPTAVTWRPAPRASARSRPGGSTAMAAATDPRRSQGRRLGRGVHRRRPQSWSSAGSTARSRPIAWTPRPRSSATGPGRSPPTAARSMQIDGNRAAAALLVLTDDLKAQVWDLKDRTCRRLPGSWTSAVFLDDDTLGS